MRPQVQKPAPQKTSLTKTPGFFAKLLSLFASDDPERKKQRELRAIGAELKRSRARLYNPLRMTAEPNLARFFWEIYRSVAAAQVILKGGEASRALKMAFVDLSLNEEQARLRERLTEKSIDERAKAGEGPAGLQAEVRGDIKALMESIDTTWMNDVDALYNRVLGFLDLVGFDYFYFLAKFDPALPERDFSYKPQFASVDADAIQEPLQDFLEILPNIDPEADWDRILSILKQHRGMEVAPRDSMRKTLALIRDVQRSGIMPRVVRHMLQDPSWKPMSRPHRERVVEPYLARLKAEAETTAQKVAHGRHNEKLEELARAVFGSSGVPAKLAHYSERSNPEYAEKMLGGFLYVKALNYLRAFLTEHLQKRIREVVDLLIVKGKWSDTRTSNQMSEAFHQLLNVSEKITRFDDDLAEGGERGRRLKTIALKAGQDRKALVQLRSALQQVNEEARVMIGDAVQHFVSIARVLKLVHEDIGKPNPALLINWKELKPLPAKELRVVIAEAYRKIYNFVQLMQMFR